MVIPILLTYFKNSLTLISLLLFCTAFSWGSTIGSITKHKGPSAEIAREDEYLSTELGTGLAMDDKITTRKTSLGLTFNDDTKVSITEQSSLIIDDFIYDPSQNTGKLAMRVALGTVKYSSGAIAKNSRENVVLNTPTSTISVRGTDFSMTVDETGKSLVILLPSCPPVGDCFVGEIEVATDVGIVLLNQAFQATVTSSRMSRPSKPVIVDVDSASIDNMLIISPPKELVDVRQIEQANNPLDVDLLEDDFLETDKLYEDKIEYLELDINRLDVEFLVDVLEATRMLKEIEEKIDPVLPTAHLYKDSVQFAYDEDNIFILSEDATHLTNVTLERDVEGYLNITKDLVPAYLQLNDGGESVLINIIQSQ
jgi:hypothetical protein